MGRSRDRAKLIELLRLTFRDWRGDNVSLMAAGLSYYAMLALAPLMVLALIVVGRLYPDEAQARITLQITRFIGPRIASAIGSMLDEASRPAGGLVPLVVSAITLFVATSSAFNQLINAFDLIWNVRPSGERGVLGTLFDRLLAFGTFLLLSLILLGTFLVTAVTARANALISVNLNIAPLWNIIFSLLLTTLLFTAIFKVLPRVQLGWRDVWVGAFVTATLFVIGKELFGVYIALSSVTSGYGAAGSLIILLIFIFYSAQILLTGAEFTKHYASRTGAQVRIEQYAERYRIVSEREPTIPLVGNTLDEEEVQLLPEAPGKRGTARDEPE
jgi:membrane protein